jgi:hypothetical protein
MVQVEIGDEASQSQAIGSHRGTPIAAAAVVAVAAATANASSLDTWHFPHVCSSS